MIDFHQRGGVVVLTLNRSPVNAISDQMVTTFQSILDRLESKTDWSVLHIRSSQKVFAAGADLDLIRSWMDAISPSQEFAAYIERLQALYMRIEHLPQVTFCEINGAAMGGGYELALSCDLRMAADEAKIGLPEVGIGLIPAVGGTQRLTRLCGSGVASRIIFSGEAVDGKTAAVLGMVQWSVASSELEEKARIITDRMAKVPIASLLAAKKCIAAAAFNLDKAGGYQLEQNLCGAMLESDKTRELITAFLDKSKQLAKQP